MRRLLLTVAVLAVAAATPAGATPVKCAESDSTPGDRVFPEPRESVTFMRFDELRCGLELLDRQHAQEIEITTLGTSKAGHPIYDVLLTDETNRGPKRKLLIISSIHGNEVGGREGGARTLEDLVDRRFLAGQPWVAKLLDEFVVHFVWPNPDGWVAGDIAGSEGAGLMATRGNDNGRDLNRQFPVKGFISAANATLAEPEGNAVLAKLFSGQGKAGWYLGTDNHGQGPDTYAAAGLQIVGEFDFQKSETLARFADGITEGMKEFGVLRELEQLRATTGQDMGAYHWGTLYDMLGYSASGSLIDFYNTADETDGTGFATELTAGTEVNYLTYPAILAQVWTDSIRAINVTMLRQAIDPRKFTFELGGRTAYVLDPAVVRHDDADGSGYARKAGENIPQRPYSATRMNFFRALSDDASEPLSPVRVGEVLGGEKRLERFDSLVLADEAMPEGRDRAAWFAALRAWVSAGGNLVLTDAALKALPELGVLKPEHVTMERHYVGFADFTDRTHPLNAGLRGVASQTYDTVPIGFAFGAQDTAPNWKLDQAAWEAAGGTTQATNGTGRTIYGELALGKGRIRVLGALLPQPTEAFYHPYGLQDHAVTYTGYTLLQNMLRHRNPARVDPPVATARPCRPARTLKVKLPRTARTRGIKVTVGGRRAKPRRRGRVLTVTLPARGTRRTTVRVTGTLRSGRRFAVRRTHKGCA